MKGEKSAGMDRNVDVRTPESIAFTYELAGLGSRFLALAVDQLLQIAILAAIFGGLVLAARFAPTKHIVESGAQKNIEAIEIAILVGIAFLVLFGYFVVFEALCNGQTPGKKLLAIRVVRDGGYPADFFASLVRNLIRIGEMAIGYYALSAISMLLSTENKRLGDFAAGTIVVRDERLMQPKELRVEPQPVYGATRYLSGDERSLIAGFLERRGGFSPQRRRDLAAQLADRVRQRVPPEMHTLDDESLLERL